MLLVVLLLPLCVIPLLWSSEKLVVPEELSSTFSFMVSHISFFRESASLCTLRLVWWINSTLLSCLNTIRIRTKVTRENQVTKSYISNSKAICARWKQDTCVGFTFSLYPVISLLLLAHTRGKSQYAYCAYRNGFHVVDLHRSAGSGCLYCCLENEFQPKPHLTKNNILTNENYWVGLRHGNVSVVGTCDMYLLTLIR